MLAVNLKFVCREIQTQLTFQLGKEPPKTERKTNWFDILIEIMFSFTSFEGRPVQMPKRLEEQTDETTYK